MAETGNSLIFVTRKWPPAMGGIETYCLKLVEELRTRRRVELIALPGAPDGSVPRFGQLLRFGLTSSARLLFARALPELIHVGDMASWPFALVARLRRPSIHIVLSAHGTDVSYGKRGGVRGRLYRAYLATGAKLLASARVIANSQATADACLEAGFRRVEIIPLASDLRAPAVQPAARGNLLFAGRLVRRKGLSWFVGNVLPLLPDSLSLDVAGTLWNDEEAASLTSPRVRYLGVLEEQALATAFAGALSVIVPNIEMENGEFEGFGLVAVEAAAAGGVVVAADIEGLRSAVRHGVTGFLVKPGDAAGWAARIVEISNWSRSDRDAFLNSSIAEVRTHFSWNRVAAETEAVYDRLIAGMP